MTGPAKTGKRCTKGIILAGGTGSRLYPSTLVSNKHLLPVYDKPMIYYPLTTLMLAGIREILLITRPEDVSSFKKLLGDGSHIGIKITYAEQEKPKGIPEAFIIGEDFIGDDPIALILGDNIFYGHGLSELLADVTGNVNKCHLFAVPVKEPSHYGVVVLGDDGKPIDIEEKPEKPKSNDAVVGLYIYDSSVVQVAKQLRPSARGETEITDVNLDYIKRNEAEVTVLGRGFLWFDVGQSDALAVASGYVQTLHQRHGLSLACPEEVAWRMNLISDDDLRALTKDMPVSQYSVYLRALVDGIGENHYVRVASFY